MTCEKRIKKMTAEEFELEGKKRQLKKKKSRFESGIAMLTGLLLGAGIIYGVLGIGFVKGSSMRPSYYNGDLILYRKCFYGELEYGDVVVIHTGSSDDVIKRIAGKPGDVIEIDDKGHLTRNGENIEETEVKFGTQSGGGTSVTYPYTVPEGCYFYLGDNRPVSLDSRLSGAVQKEKIAGKVFGTLRLSSGR